MSIYELSVMERRRQAQERARIQAAVKVQERTAAEEEDEKGFWATLGDFGANILKGAMKSIEGIYDLGASAVGGVGGWFSDDFEEAVRSHVEYDVTEQLTPWVDELEKYSYLGEDSFIRSVAQGVGGMLPAVVMGGLSHIGAVGTATMMAGAAGQGTEEAMKSGADYGSALAYGVASGAVEGLTEKIGGYTFGGGTSKVGKAIAGTKFGNAVSKGVGKVVFDAVSEGAEEVLADYIDPALKYVTRVDKNIGENYLEAAKNTGETFLTGAAVGSAMQGGQTLVRSGVNKLKGRGGAKATRADTAMQNILEVTKNYTGASNTDIKYDNSVKNSLKQISDELVKMTPEQRGKYLEGIGVYKSAFDKETGALKENAMPYAHREAVSANLRTFSGNLTHKPLKGTESITEGAKTAKKTVERVVGNGASVVVTNELSAEDRAIYNPDDGVIYINNKAKLTGEDVAKAVALHEVTHLTEGTKAYTKLVEQIKAIMQDKNAPESVKKILGDVNLRTVSTAIGYEKDMESMSGKQAAYLVETEVNADLIGDLLSDDYFIEKLAERDMGLLEKLYHSFKNRANAKKSELDPDGIKYLKKIVSKFGTAIEKRAGGVKLSQIGDEDEEKEKPQEAVVSNERASKENISNISVSKKDVDVLRKLVKPGERKSINEFTTQEIEKTEIWARKFFKELGVKSPYFRSWFGDWRAYDNGQSQVVEHSKTAVFKAGKAINKDTSKVISWSRDLRSETTNHAVGEKKAILATSDIEAIVKNAVYFDTVVSYPTSKSKMPNTAFMHSYYTIYEEAGAKYLLKLFVEEALSNDETVVFNRAYQLKDIAKVANIPNSVHFKKEGLTDGTFATTYSIHELFDIVKQYDKNFNPKSASKVVNDDGTPKVVYHGTNAKFTVFDYDKTKLGKLGYGFYFTTNKNFAKNYAGGDNLVEAYIDIKDPLIIEETVLTEKQIDSMLEKLSEFELKADGKNIQELKEELMSQETEISRNFLFLKIASKYQDILDNMGDVIGFDGIIDKNWDEYVVFSSNQIKSATDNIGTFDRDNPDIRYSRKRAYDPKNSQDITFEAVEGGVKVNFNDFEPHKSNDNSNDYEAAERARQESLDALLKDGEPPRYSPVSADTDTALLRKVVNNTKAKKYTRKEMSITIDEILSQDGYFGDNIVSLKGKKRAEAEKMLWRELNTKDKGELGGAALKVADYIIQNAIATEYIDVTDDVQLAVQFIDAVKPYLHNMNLEAIKGDIQTKFDKDRSPFLMWSVKKNSQFRGYTADEVKQELEALGLGYNIDKTNEADIFLEIDELYRAAKQTVIDATPSKQTLFTAVGYKEFKDLRQKIAKDILKAQEEKGTETTFYKIQQKYIGRIEELSEKVRDLHRKETLERQILKEIKKIEESKSGKYFNSTQIQMDALQALKGKLKGLDSQEQVNRSSTRDIMATLADWYTEDNPVLKGFEHNGKTNEQTRFFSKQIYELIQYFKGDSGNAPLTMTELRNIRIVLHHMNFIFEHYGQIWRGNRYVDAKDVATELIESLKIAEKSGAKITTNMISKFFMDPMAVLAEMDGHDPNGFFTTTYKELAEGIVKQKAYEIEILEEFEAFRKANKKYMKSFIGGKDTIKMIGRIDRDGKITTVEVPKYAAIDLYMVSKTGNALQTLEETGWRLVLDGEHVQGDFQTITKEQLDALYKQFSAKDKELISIIEKAYNGKCRDLKYETDMIRLGFTNVFEGYYYPIRRTVRTDFDSETYWAEMERVSNISANKSRVKGVKNEIIVSNAITKFFSHVNAISRYSALSIPVENMSVLYNIDTLDNPRKPTSVKTTITQSDKWKGAEEYLFALAEDAQAMRNKMSRGTAAYQYLRGAYSGFALGFNPKTLLTQVSSYIAGFGELRFSSLTKGLTMIGKIKDADLDKYCPWAKVRHYERGVTRAESQTEKIGKISGFFSKGMEFVDRKIIKLEFAACQYEAKARFGLEFGTEENLIKAGELLTEIGLKTQQNQLATEKSAAMRSDSELWKTATMFKSDSMKLLSRMAQNISACISVKRQIRFAKAENNLEHIRTLEARYKEAKKHVSKYLAVIISSSVYMVLIARMFDKLYGKADEEENEVLGFCEDIGGNIAGMVPIVADLYNFFVDGYEVESFAYGMINDVLGSAQKIFQISGDLMSGKNVGTEKVAMAVRNVIYAATQLVGIPTRNAYKVVRGAVGLVSDSGGVSMDAWFKQFSNTEVIKQLKTAIETGDESLTEKSLEQLYRNYDVSIADKSLKAEMDRLIRLDVTKDEDDENNYSSLGFKIPGNLEIDGEDTELSAEDRKVFKNGLKLAEKSSAAMVKTYYYKKLSDKYRAYALRKVFEYYDLMSRETVGAVSEERARLLYYGEAIGIDMLAVLLAYKQELNAVSDEEKTRRGKSTKELVTEYLKRFNLTPVQKSLVLRALGYSDKDNDKLVKSFIERRPGLSKEQRAEFTQIAKCDL